MPRRGTGALAQILATCLCRPPVGKRDTCQMNCQCLFIYQVHTCWCSIPLLHLTRKQVTLRGKEHELWEREHNDKSTRGKCTRVRIFAKHTIRGKATTVIHLAPRTHNTYYWRVCQIPEMHNSAFCHKISVQRVSFIWPSQHGVIISYAALKDSCLWQ